MVLTKSTKDFVEDLINYYIAEVSSYKRIAEEYSSKADSVMDTAFGIIAGCVYNGFLQVYSIQNQKASLEDIQDFHKIMKKQAPLIRKALIKSESQISVKDKLKIS